MLNFDIDRLKKKVSRKMLGRVGACALATVLVASAAYAGVNQGNASEVMATTDETLEKEYPELLKSPEVGDMGKSETVYVIKDADGNTTEMTAEEWITNGEKKDELEDVTKLENIENVSGNEEFEQNGNSIVWKADGNDIRYKGDYTGYTPVDVEISYYLDGKKMTAKEIAGKEGNVEIHFDYKVNEMDSVNGYNLYHPFIVVSAAVLSNEHFADVETSSGGKVVNDGSNAACVGISMPGMNENLGISRTDLDIPRDFVIKAYTDKFSLEGTYTIITSGMFADMDGGELHDASDMLSQLEKGLKQMNSASDELVGATAMLSEGADELHDGTKELKAGSKKLVDGSSTLTKGLNELKANSPAINAGTAQIESAIFDTASTQLSQALGDKVELNPGNYKAVLKDIPEKAIQKAEAELRGALSKSGVTDSNVQTMILSLTFNNLMEAGKTAPSKDEITEAIQTAGGEAQQASYVGSVPAELKQAAAKALEGTPDEGDQTKILALAVAMNMAVDAGKAPTEYGEYLEAAQNYLVAANKYQLAADGAAAHVKTLAAMAVGGDTDKQLKAVEKQLDDVETYVAGVKAYTAGVDAAAAGSAELNTGIKTFNSGVGDLEEGADTLADGAEELAEGMRAFDSKAIKTFVHKLSGKELTDVTKRYKAIVEADKRDMFVCGKPDGMDGASKIIVKTGEVKK